MKEVKLDSKNSVVSDLVQQELDSLGIDLKKLGYSDVSDFTVVILKDLFDNMVGSIVQGNKKQLIRAMMEQLIQQEGVIKSNKLMSDELGFYKYKININEDDRKKHTLQLGLTLIKLIGCLPLESLDGSDNRINKSDFYHKLVDSCHSNVVVRNYIVEHNCNKYELIKELGLEDAESYQKTAANLVVVADLIRKKFYRKFYQSLNNYYRIKGETNTIIYNDHSDVRCIFLIKYQSLFDKHIMIEYRGGGYGYDSFYEVGVGRLIRKGAQIILIEEEVKIKDF